MLRLEDTLTVQVPNTELLETMETALVGLSASEAVSLDVLTRRITFTNVIGPSTLLYALDGFAEPEAEVETVEPAALAELLDAVPRDELDESGLADVRDIVSIHRADAGDVVAACGWIRWPFDVAHLCVMSHPRHRGLGLAKRVAADAVRRTQAGGLVPQWRARVPASLAVARSIGMTEVGMQLRLLVPQS